MDTNFWYDPSKVAAATAAQGVGTNGSMLSGQNLMSILNTLQGAKAYSSDNGGMTPMTSGYKVGNDMLDGGIEALLGRAGDKGVQPVMLPDTWNPTGSGESYDAGYTPGGIDQAATAKAAEEYRKMLLTRAGLDPNKQYAYANRAFDTPGGNGGKDKATILYEIGANGSAKPVSAHNQYDGSWWTDIGRDFAKSAASMALGAYGAGSAISAAGLGSAGTSAAQMGAEISAENGGYASSIGAGGGGGGGSGGLLGSAGTGGLTAEQLAYTAVENAAANAGGLGNYTAAQMAAGAGSTTPGLMDGVKSTWNGLSPTQQSMLTKGATGAAMSAATGGNPVTGAVSGAVGAGVGGLLDSPAAGQIAGGLVGAAIGSQTGSGGALSGLNSATSTAQNTIDPRMSKYLYGADGSGGLLAQVAALQAQQAQNGGLNATQHQGIDMQKAALLSPGYTQGLDQMRSAGSGLLGGPMAGNPFTSGQASLNPAQPAQQPMQVAPQAQVPGWQPMQTQLNQQRPQMTGLLGNLRPYGN
jgi:hypothetical protein